MVGDNEVIEVGNNDSSDDNIEGPTDIVADVSEVPMTGMLFPSADEMFEFYKNYGQHKGFSVKRRTTNKGKDGVVRYITFTCGRSDKLISRSKNVLSHRPHSKNECKARLRARLSAGEKWEITMFQDDHNHVLIPNKSRFFYGNRYSSSHVKRQLEIDDTTEIRSNKSHNAQVIGANGHGNLPFLEKDTQNLIAKVRRMRLGEGDADAIQSYFLKMQSQNESFFSMIDWDEKGCLKNIFWADPRSRAAYREFGDVITFDTTYLTSKYDMPFAPFVGINHHGQSILFGCGLISNKDTETFIWLFRTWLACMSGVAPSGIITDQDRALKNAIAVVFPGSMHRLCLWSMLKKVPEKLCSYKQYEPISYAFKNVVYDSQSIVEFEDG
ncbi:protein FAR1-RELATED SEQUENCE 5-like [Tripterygium wilfordii]|uniref:protein FAR1-RELATED SEQUENCE 5-like n=1 Tax=Tripterygium wilfordii TaxID=458696 RepID=UPI0018F83313|nr:protein FAR1-RELATED SEQUENCE 5-like [Tripterygium wilfordii]XP_038678690.1 protein FAR1-RELATED SEQUENCE 5-like [Tripterygium wilfordii]